MPLTLLLSFTRFHYGEYHCIQLYICEDNVFYSVFQIFFTIFHPPFPHFHVGGRGVHVFLYILLERIKKDVDESWGG